MMEAFQHGGEDFVIALGLLGVCVFVCTVAYNKYFGEDDEEI